MLSALLSAVVPTFGIIATGWFCRWRGIFSKDAIRGLNGYAYLIALPALIFKSVFEQVARAQPTLDDLRYLGGLVAAHLLVFTIAVVILHRSRREVRTVGPMLLTFGSTAYLGIPFATFAFGPQGTAYAALGSVALVVTMLFASLTLLNRGGKREVRTTSWHQLLELPFLWVVLAGILLPTLGVRALPGFLEHTIDVLAGSAGPTALLAIGAFDYDLNLRKIAWRYAIPFGVGKVIFPTAATAVILAALGITGLPLVVGCTLAATSIAITAFILADEYRIGRELTDGAIAVSTLTAFVVLSGIAWFWTVTRTITGS